MMLWTISSVRNCWRQTYLLMVYLLYSSEFSAKIFKRQYSFKLVIPITIFLFRLKNVCWCRRYEAVRNQRLLVFIFVRIFLCKQPL